MPSFARKSNFRTVQQFQVDYAPVTISQYVSERTGMQMVVVDQKGPKVNGYFALATEVLDDSGSPHTLEHLCFMGSRSYQYKGVLDKLSNRAYSTTNAWTATDHTAYTLDTAGWAGFAQILPVYLEHIIVPTLTDAGCLTEVFHVDGEGNDAGVVYSEMQGVQNTQSMISDVRANRLMYPEGVGFRYETGGLMENLRVLTADRIRTFHREMYQPKNFCLVIMGEVDHDDLLQIVDDFEETIADSIPEPNAPFKRPWIETSRAPPLEKTILETLEFPEEDESMGEVIVRFLGPDCNDVLAMAAIDVLFTYLAGSPASLLENVIVEKEQIASAVYYSKESRPRSTLELTLSGVETEKLAQAEARLFELLNQACQDKVDMVYMNECILLSKRRIQFGAERGGSFFAEPLIADFLFGNRNGSDLKTVQNLNEYDGLQGWTEVQWQEFLSEWLAKAHHVSLLMKPSARLSTELKETEKQRVAAQKEKLGEKGMKRLAEKLEAAKAENNREIPREMLEQFKVPDPTSIPFIHTTTARSGHARDMGKLDNPIQAIIDKEASGLPLFIHFEQTSSNFVHLVLLLGTSVLPLPLRPLLTVYLENFFSTPLTRNGQRIEFEQVVMELERDTVDYGIESAEGFSNPEMLRIDFKVEAAQYQTAIAWLRETIGGAAIFDPVRIKATLARLLADIPEEKRNGSDMVYAVKYMLHTAPASISRARSALVRAFYLKRISRLLETSPDTVLGMLADIRAHFFTHSNLRALVIGDIAKLTDPVSSWKTLVAGLDTSAPLQPLDDRLQRLTDAGRNPGGLSYVIPMPTVDSSYCLSVAKGPTSELDPQFPALLVAIAYLNAVEGPLWTSVRGTGLAYGASVSKHLHSADVSFDVYRSPDAFKAFAAGKAAVEDLVSGKTAVDALAMEGAVSSIVLDIASKAPNMGRAAQDSFVGQVIRGLPKDYNERALERVRDVGVEEMKTAMRNVLLPAFQPETANVMVTCAPNLEETIVAGFKSMGFSPEVRTLASFQDDYGLKGDDGDADDDDDGDDDGDEEGEDTEQSEEA